MLNEDEIRDRMAKRYIQEQMDDKESYWWMSFVDPDKEEGKRFTGVIIVKALGISHALIKTHKLKINPGGEVKFVEIPLHDKNIKTHHLDRLLQKDELEKINSPKH